MADPILQVRDLHTHFFADEGAIRAVDGASFDVYAGRTLGRLDHPEPLGAQQHVDEVADMRIVLDDDDRALGHGTSVAPRV